MAFSLPFFLSFRGRSPSWGAWIEILSKKKDGIEIIVAPPRGERGLKYLYAPFFSSVAAVAPPRGERGLKLAICFPFSIAAKVAPPRGERGLKFHALMMGLYSVTRRSPSWGAWIEMAVGRELDVFASVAPPRGERGLKYPCRVRQLAHQQSLPLVGSVD